MMSFNVFFMFLWLQLSSQLSGAAESTSLLNTNFITKANAETTTKKQLSLEVLWVLQGHNFGFTGFFIEFLGLSSALNNYFPGFKLIQSSYREFFNESALDNSNILKSLFPVEQVNIRKLYSNTRNSDAAALNEGSVVATEGTIDANYVDQICSGSDNNSEKGNGHTFVHDELLNMWRPEVSDATSPSSCCSACLAVSHCLGWSLSTGPTVDSSPLCELKGAFLKDAAANEVLPNSNIVIRAGNVLVPSPEISARLPQPRIKIFHGTTCFYQNFSLLKQNIREVRIGRYMVERERFAGGMTLHELAVMKCAVKMDEIWVPTQWNKEIFDNYLQSVGFTDSQVYVIPEAVDITLFDPELVKQKKTKFGGNAFCKNIESIASEDNKLRTKFEFLSIFKWEHRKGWDILLRAYWSAFKRGDDVLLRLHTYVPGWVRGETNITRIIELFAASEFDRPLSELAPILWEVEALQNGIPSRELTRSDVRELYASADAFVLPTRGEGWGLPVAEAMAMAIPVIVTNFSGPVAYATQDNSYLIPVMPGLDELGFCRPNTTALAEIMIHVVRESCPHSSVVHGETTTSMESVAQLIGLSGRISMSHWSPDYVVAEMSSRIYELAKERGYKL